MSISKTQAPKDSVPTGVGMRKRQQIASSNKTMFLWVAGASVVVAFALVLSVFLVKQIMFTEKVLTEKGKTIGNLEDNKETADDLRKNVNKLRANKGLTASRSSASDNNLDVVIDALPYEADPEAVAASLQNILLVGVSVESVEAKSDSSESDSVAGADAAALLEPIGESQPIAFSFKVSGTSEQLKELFSRLDRSIRPIQVHSVQIESAGAGGLTASVQASTFYQPQRTMELKEKVVKP